MQIFDFLHFFQTLIFWSKKHSFLSRISKNDLLWLDFPKHRIWENRRFFDKNHGITPLQIFDFLHFFQTSLFRSKKHSFLFRISKSNLLWLDFPKKPLWKKRPFFYQNHGLTPLQIFEFFIWENGRFFDKNHGLTPLQIFDFLQFIQTLLFRSKKHSFLSRISKNDL